MPSRTRAFLVHALNNHCTLRDLTPKLLITLFPTVAVPEKLSNVPKWKWLEDWYKTIPQNTRVKAKCAMRIWRVPRGSNKEYKLHNAIKDQLRKLKWKGDKAEYRPIGRLDVPPLIPRQPRVIARHIVNVPEEARNIRMQQAAPPEPPLVENQVRFWNANGVIRQNVEVDWHWAANPAQNDVLFGAGAGPAQPEVPQENPAPPAPDNQIRVGEDRLREAQRHLREWDQIIRERREEVERREQQELQEHLEQLDPLNE